MAQPHVNWLGGDNFEDKPDPSFKRQDVLDGKGIFQIIQLGPSPRFLTDNLSVLILDGNRLTQQLGLIAHLLLMDNCKLSHLSLRQNALSWFREQLDSEEESDSEMIALPELTSLHLLFESLLVNTSLVTLDLGDNCLGSDFCYDRQPVDRSTFWLARALILNCTLKSLHIDANRWDHVDIQLLLHSSSSVFNLELKTEVTSLPTLLCLDLGKIPPMDQPLHGLIANAGLETLLACAERIAPDQLMHLWNCNRTIQTISIEVSSWVLVDDQRQFSAWHVTSIAIEIQRYASMVPGHNERTSHIRQLPSCVLSFC